MRHTDLRVGIVSVFSMVESLAQAACSIFYFHNGRCFSGLLPGT